MKLFFMKEIYVLLYFISPVCFTYPCFPENMLPYQLKSEYFDIKVPSNGSSPTTDVAQWDLGKRMKIFCTGGKPKESITAPVFYKFNPLLTFGGLIPGPMEREYIVINDHFALAFDIWLGGMVNKYVKINGDGKWVSNNHLSKREFDNNGELFINDTQTGNKGKVYLWIKKPFIGRQEIKPTKVINVAASFSNISDNASPYMDLTISGAVTSDASCQFTEKVYVIEYGDLTPSAITSLSQLGNNKLGKQLILNVNCSQNIAQLPMTMSLVGTSATSEAKAFSTSHPDIGIAVKANDKLVQPLQDMASIPNADQQIETKTNGTQKSATIQVYPVKLDDKVSPGEFKATATLKVDFK